MIACAASPATVLLPIEQAYTLVSHGVLRTGFRSPARTKRRWLRDHRRMMRDNAISHPRPVRGKDRDPWTS